MNNPEQEKQLRARFEAWANSRFKLDVDDSGFYISKETCRVLNCWMDGYSAAHADCAELLGECKEALMDAKEFVECDMQSSDYVIAAYAGRVCDKINAILDRLKGIRNED